MSLLSWGRTPLKLLRAALSAQFVDFGSQPCDLTGVGLLRMAVVTHHHQQRHRAHRDRQTSTASR